jgi:spore germination protein YaaH
MVTVVGRGPGVRLWSTVAEGSGRVMVVVCRTVVGTGIETVVNWTIVVVTSAETVYRCVTVDREDTVLTSVTVTDWAPVIVLSFVTVVGRGTVFI